MRELFKIKKGALKVFAVNRLLANFFVLCACVNFERRCWIKVNGLITWKLHVAYVHVGCKSAYKRYDCISRGHTRFQTTQFTRFENDRAIVLWRHQEQ